MVEVRVGVGREPRALWVEKWREQRVFGGKDGQRVPQVPESARQLGLFGAGRLLMFESRPPGLGERGRY